MNKLEKLHAIIRTPTPKHQRRGQFLMNSLADIDRELYVAITGTVLDPFYDDKKVIEFIEHVSIIFTREELEA